MRGYKAAQGNTFPNDRSTDPGAAEEEGSINSGKLKGGDTTITKSSLGSCVSCLARFAAALGRIGGSSDPYSLRFRGSQPCYHNDNSSLERWTLWQRSYPASSNQHKAKQIIQDYLGKCSSLVLIYQWWKETGMINWMQWWVEKWYRYIRKNWMWYWSVHHWVQETNRTQTANEGASCPL